MHHNNQEEWLTAYRSNKEVTWIKCKLSNNTYIFINDFSEWTDLKKRCDKESLFLDQLSFQFRSHEVDIDIENIDGVYLIRSILGKMGSRTKNYYTVGKIIGDKVDKEMWLIPELIMEEAYEDTVDNCFEESIIYDQKKKKN